MQSFISLPKRGWLRHGWGLRSAAVCAVCLVLIGLVALIAPWLFSAIALRSDIEEQIRATTGLAVQSHGPAVLVVLPEPHVNIENVRFSDPSGALTVETPMLKGYFRILPLLLGRLEIASASLFDADLTIDLDGHPLPSDSAIGRAADARPASPQAERTDTTKLGVLTFINGRAHLKTRSSFKEELLSNINATLDWRQMGAAAQLAGSLDFHEQSVDLSAWIAKPVDLLRGGPSDINLRIEAPALSFSSRGRLSNEPQFHYAGTIESTTPSLRALLELVDHPLPLPGPFADLVLSSNVVIDDDSAAFSDLHLEIDGNRLEGTLALQHLGEKPVLSGTLATGLLTVTPWLERLPPARDGSGDWSSEPFSFAPTNLADLDLRISASRLRLPPIELQDAAISIMTREDRLELVVPAAKAYQGAFKGRASLKLEPEQLAFRANATLSGLDLSAFSADFFGQRRFGGLVTGTVNLEGGGDTLLTVMRSLEGHIQANVLQGEIDGLALDQALRHLEKRPLALLASIHGGRTYYDEGNLGLNVAHGVANIEDGLLQSQSLRIALGGQADIGDRTLKLHAVVTPASTPSVKPDPAELPQDLLQFRFDILGPWDDPELIPDVQSLIRRSNAAAPLFRRKPGSVQSPSETSDDSTSDK